MSRAIEEVRKIPRIGSGKPTMRGVLVSVIANRFLAGESVTSLADDYGMLTLEIEKVIRYAMRERSHE